MSYHEQNGGGYPPPPRDQAESQYPPPPGEEDNRATAYHNRGPSTGVTLPSISPYDHQYSQPPNGYGPPDPRYAQDPYRGQQGGYRDDRGYQQDYARGGGQHMAFSQSAPRQRTAIACRYCRRRKIRCSGFDQNPEGRCINCQRFQQECIFTPVSSQAQAFVPAHAVFPNMRNMGIGPDGRPRPMGYPQGPPAQLYGAHGQPLPGAPLTNSPYEYPAPSPTGSYNSYSDDRGSQPSNDSSRKRPLQDPHSGVLPPPIPGQSQPPYSRTDSSGPRREAASEDYRLPPVTPNPGAPANYSPGSSTSSHSNLQPPAPGQLPSMSRTPPPRSSPGGDSRADPMSLGNIMERRPDQEIDRGMLGRLDRKGK